MICSVCGHPFDGIRNHSVCTDLLRFREKSEEADKILAESRIVFDKIEREAKERLTADLLALETALDTFLSGEIRDGLITPFKLTLIVQANTLLALAERSRRDIPSSEIRRT